MSEQGQRTLVRVLHLTEGPAKTYQWETQYTAWANVQTAERKNLFSAVGIGARGVTLTMWKNGRFDLFHALQLHDGTYCFPTSIVPCDDGLHVTVQAAVVSLTPCTSREGIVFPGILTEKYIAHEQLSPGSVLHSTFVLVAPKSIALPTGSLVDIGGKLYDVQVPHLLDEYKNEYEILCTEDI